MRAWSSRFNKALIAFPVSIAILTAIACGSFASPAPTATPLPIDTPLPADTPEPQAGESSGPVDLEQPYDEQADPEADIAAALAAAKTDSKNVLLDFGANWCLDCVVLTTLFEDDTVKPFLDENFHVVRIDVGYWDKNLSTAEKYDNPIEKGIPAVVVLTPDGEMVATTKAGELASARSATAEDILAYLQEWAPKK